ncbi:MAG: hypothetical protein N2255_09135 [Kiritimatiellae bacterium]|nr:hypothetical protein [Kiritimatiellia bacterium]
MPKAIVTGMAVDRDRVEWAVLRLTREKPIVLDSGHAPMVSPTGDGNGTGGEQNEGPARVQASKELGPRLKGEITIGISSDEVLLRVITLPNAEPEELRGMVELQLDKFSPFPPESMVVSHEIIKRGDQTSLVLVAAVKEETVSAIIEKLAAGGILPERVDAAPLAWWRLLTDEGKVPREGRHVFVLLHGGTPELIVAEDGIPILFRPLPGTTGLDEGQLAEEIGNEISYTLMALELEYGARPTESIRIWYRGTPPDRFARKLGERFACNAFSQSLDSLPGLAVGLARRHAAAAEPAIDLTPVRWSARKAGRILKRRILMAAAGILGVWFLTVVGFVAAFTLHRHSLTTLRQEYERWKQPAVEVREMRNRVMLIKRYLDRKQSPLECLREVALLQPAGVDLTSFLYKKGEVVKIAGEGDSVGLVYDFKKSLDGSGLFREARLQGPRRDIQRRKEIFDMDLKLPPSEG